MAIISSSTFLTSPIALKLLPSLSPLLRSTHLSLSPPISFSLPLLPLNKNYFSSSLSSFSLSSSSSFALGGKEKEGGPIGEPAIYSHTSSYKEEEEEDEKGEEEGIGGFPGNVPLDSVPYHKELANRARMIGTVAYALDFSRFDNGKRKARASLDVRSSSGEKTRFVLEFWNELAEVAATHIKESDQIYVDGKLSLESYLGKDNVQKTVCKVTAQDFKFVHGFPSNLKWNDSSPKFEERKLLTAKLWQEYFADPSEWWDNRVDKMNPKAIGLKQKTIEERNLRGRDFNKHKTIEERNLKAPDFKHRIFEEKNPRAPDFKHKTIEEAIWINDQTPEWALRQLQILDSGPKPWQTPKPSVSFQDFNLGDI